MDGQVMAGPALAEPATLVPVVRHPGRPESLLPEAHWRARRRSHEQRVDALLADHHGRRRTGVRHPVADFLFTYYRYRPAQLRRWHPGCGVVLAGAGPAEMGPGYAMVDGGAGVDARGVLARRRSSVIGIRDLLTATATRAPQLGCFGLHEWAMVYRQTVEELRHQGWPLRLDPRRTAAVVEQNRIRCSHYDAFRFFTSAARPLNALCPSRDRQLDLEQPGCLHANMDLYKWAYKLSPLVASELVADCYELAAQLRVLDMRASPYDLTALGFLPVRIETPEGRAEYVARQREFADRASVLRGRLITACEAALRHGAAAPIT